MNYKKIVYTTVTTFLLVFCTWLLYATYIQKPEQPLFQTQAVEQRTITQSIKATGYIELEEDMMKIGSIVSGVIQKMYVEENEHVTKGMLIAEIDDGKGDTEVRSTLAEVKKTQAIADYQERFYQRQKILHTGKHISDNDFDKITQDFHVAQADLLLKQALHDAANLTYKNKKIVAPDNGIVIAKLAKEGETVTLASPATLIYTIAKNIKKMKAQPAIDESSIGNLTIGAQASLYVDTYPYRTFQGTVSDISNAAINTNGAITYLATILLDNSELLFRPGMSVDVQIVIAQKHNVLSVPGYVFKINRTTIKQIAALKKYKVIELPPEERKKLDGNSKSVWIYTNDTFIEKTVSLGLNDNAYFEIVSGLDQGDQLIVDTLEPDSMEQFFQRFFGQGLS